MTDANLGITLASTTDYAIRLDVYFRFFRQNIFYIYTTGLTIAFFFYCCTTSLPIEYANKLSDGER